MTDNTVIIRRPGLVVVLSEDSSAGVPVEDYTAAIHDALRGLGYSSASIDGILL